MDALTTAIAVSQLATLFPFRTPQHRHADRAT
jgi:hypothetical protein